MKALSVRAKILTAFTVVSLICTLGILPGTDRFLAALQPRNWCLSE